MTCLLQINVENNVKHDRNYPLPAHGGYTNLKILYSVPNHQELNKTFGWMNKCVPACKGTNL